MRKKNWCFRTVLLSQRDMDNFHFYTKKKYKNNGAGPFVTVFSGALSARRYNNISVPDVL